MIGLAKRNGAEISNAIRLSDDISDAAEERDCFFGSLPCGRVIRSRKRD